MHWVQLHGDSLEITTFIYLFMLAYNLPYFTPLDVMSWKSMRQDIKSSSPTPATNSQSDLKQVTTLF